jgi:serine/threonine-protein kinase
MANVAAAVNKTVRRFGRYEVAAEIASPRFAGGSTVYIAIARATKNNDPSTSSSRLALSHAPAKPNEPTKTIQRPVAIKRIDPALMKDATKVNLFLDAARKAAELQHPNLTDVGEVALDGDGLYVAMEFIIGETAASLVKRLHSQGERLKPVLAAHIIAEACAGLEAGHAAGLIHGHLTPHDIFIGHHGSVHVLDVGIAHARHILADSQIDGVELEYSSPERCNGEPVDGRSDVFSLGSILWELLTGLSPFERAADKDVMRAIRDEPVVPPKNVVPGLPKEISEITVRALERDKTKRFESTLAFRTALLEPITALSNGFSPDAALGTLMKRQFAERSKDKRELVQDVILNKTIGEGLDFLSIDRSERSPRPLPPPPGEVSLPSASITSGIMSPAKSNPPPTDPGDQASIIIAPSAGMVTPVGALSDPPPPPSARSMAPAPASTSAPPTAPPVADDDPIPGPPKNSRTAMIGIVAGFVVLVAIIGAIVAGTRNSKPDVKTAASVTPPASTSVAVITPPPPASTPAPAPTPDIEITPMPSSAGVPGDATQTLLHIETIPSGSTVTVDGVKQGTSPVDVHVPKGSTPITIELRHHNYYTLRENVVPDMNQRLKLTLVGKGAGGGGGKTTTAPAAAPAPAPGPANPYKKFE